MGSLESPDGVVAKCATHGGEYKILFSRQPFLMPKVAANAPQTVLTPETKCRWHPSAPAIGVCADCGGEVCSVCAFPVEPAGIQVCPLCAELRASKGPPAAVQPRASVEPAMPAGVVCRQHPALQATSQCKVCGTFMCDTCAFDMPGGIKVCPACATAPRPAFSHKRKILLIGSFVAAVWCTLVLGALFAGLFREMGRDKDGRQVLGMLLMFILIIPSVIGLALGLSAMERRMNNPMGIWIATIWNGIILGSFVLLTIYGVAKSQ